jgi:glycosylphosphatidylinositol transamidase (GPIT) subunit GPI8
MQHFNIQWQTFLLLQLLLLIIFSVLGLKLRVLPMLVKCFNTEVQLYTMMEFFFFNYKICIRIYSFYREGFKVTIPIRLRLYIIYFSPNVSPRQLPPHPTQSNCKRIFSSVSYRYMQFTCHIPSS